MQTTILRSCVILLAMWASVVTQAAAHTIRPAVMTMDIMADGTVEVLIETNAEALLSDIGPEHADTDDSPNAVRYNAFRALPADELRAVFRDFAPAYVDQLGLTADGRPVALTFAAIDVPEVGDLDLARKSRITLTGALPPEASTLQWAYPEVYGSNVLRVRVPGTDTPLSFWLQAGEVSPDIDITGAAPPPSTWTVMWDYTVIGFTHILPLGLDHILFVLGIFLLSLRLSPILWQVTAFTVAHTITLGMSIYGLITLSPSIVEPLIAASIVYVGVENVLTKELKPWRIAIVFLFGLLHGMGFAGVLSEIGLPEGEFLTALITFNIGVELGQLAVIALAFLAVGWFRHEPWYRDRIVIPASIGIALIGAYWAIERVFF